MAKLSAQAAQAFCAPAFKNILSALKSKGCQIEALGTGMPRRPTYGMSGRMTFSFNVDFDDASPNGRKAAIAALEAGGFKFSYKLAPESAAEKYIDSEFGKVRVTAKVYPDCLRGEFQFSDNGF